MNLVETPSPTESRDTCISEQSYRNVYVRGNNVRLAYKVTQKKVLSDAYLIGFLFGIFGAHHFYLKNRFFGILYLFTFGLCFVGYLSDLCRMPKLVKRANRRIKERNALKTTIHHVYLDDAYVLWFPFGIFGFHHFYMRRYIRGIIYLWTFGLFGLGWISDLCFMPKHVKSANQTQEAKAVMPRVKKRLSDVYVFALFPVTGILGIHHFLLDRPVNGIFYTLTFGGFFVGYIVDLFRMPLLIKRYNEQADFTAIKGKKHLDSAYVYLVPFGILGFHHYYLGNYARGAVYTCTFGVMGIFWLIDFFRLPGLVREHNAIIDEGEKMMTNVLMQHSASIEGHSPSADLANLALQNSNGQHSSNMTLDANVMMNSGLYMEPGATSQLQLARNPHQFPITPPPEYSETTFASSVGAAGLPSARTNLRLNLTGVPSSPRPTQVATISGSPLSQPHTASSVHLEQAGATSTDSPQDDVGMSSTASGGTSAAHDIDDAHTPENQLDVANKLGIDIDETECSKMHKHDSRKDDPHGVDHTLESQLDVSTKLGLQEIMMDEMEACGVSNVNIREPDPHSKRNQIEIAQTLGITDEYVCTHF